MSTQKTLADKIVKASIVVGIAHLCLKFAGLVQAKFCAQYLSDSEYTAVIAVAFGAILNSLFLIGEECIGPTFLTLFVREKEQKSEDAAWAFTNVTLTYQALLLIAVAASIVCFPDFYIRMVTQLRPPVMPLVDASSEAFAAYEQEMAHYLEVYKPLRYSLQVIAPSLLFLSLGSTTYVLLNGYKKFFLSAFGDASTKIFIIIGIVVGWYMKLGLSALCFGILVGSVAKLLTHFIGLRGKLHYLRPNFDFRNSAFKAMLLLMVPLLLGILFAKFRDIFNNIYVLTGKNVPDYESVVKANDLGRKLYTTIQWLVPYALQIALFPFLCDLVNTNDRKKLGEVVGNSCRLLLSVFMPLSATLVVIGVPLTVLIFLGGKTTAEVATMAGVSTMCYSCVLPASAIECVLMQGAFADRRTVAVTIIGIGSSMLSVILSAVFIVWQGVGSMGALVVVALGFVASRFIKSAILILYMRRTMPMFQLKETLAFFWRAILLTTVVALVAYGASWSCNYVFPDGLSQALSGDSSASMSSIRRGRLIVRIAMTSLAGLLAFWSTAKAIHFKEPLQMAGWVLGKITSKIHAKH